MGFVEGPELLADASVGSCEILRQPARPRDTANGWTGLLPYHDDETPTSACSALGASPSLGGAAWPRGNDGSPSGCCDGDCLAVYYVGCWVLIQFLFDDMHGLRCQGPPGSPNPGEQGAICTSGSRQQRDLGFTQGYGRDGVGGRTASSRPERFVRLGPAVGGSGAALVGPSRSRS